MFKPIFQDCDTGYTRSGGGLYLGLCEPCNCYGHSSECDPETGECRVCMDLISHLLSSDNMGYKSLKFDDPYN